MDEFLLDLLKVRKNWLFTAQGPLREALLKCGANLLFRLWLGLLGTSLATKTSHMLIILSVLSLLYTKQVR